MKRSSVRPVSVEWIELGGRRYHLRLEPDHGWTFYYRDSDDGDWVKGHENLQSHPGEKFEKLVQVAISQGFYKE